SNVPALTAISGRRRPHPTGPGEPRRLPLLDSLSVRCLSSYLFFRPYFGGNYAYASQGRVGVPCCAPFLLPLHEIGKRTSGYFGGACEIELPWVGISLSRCRSPISGCAVVGLWSHGCWAGFYSRSPPRPCKQFPSHVPGSCRKSYGCGTVANFSCAFAADFRAEPRSDRIASAISGAW